MPVFDGLSRFSLIAAMIYPEISGYNKYLITHS
jgi:hypothetical protein